jgi:hypothetical protein
MTKSGEVLAKAQEMFRAAECGLQDLIKGSPFRKETGFKDLVVYGRAVTNVLQNLRNETNAFDEWYLPYQQEMNSDPLMKYFYKLRSKILKEGDSESRLEDTEIKELRLAEDILAYRPEGAERYSVGFRGVCWLVEREDGSVERHFVDLPTSAIDSKAMSTSTDLPSSHLGKTIEDCSIENLSILYIDYLRRVVLSAQERFSGSIQSQ